MTAVQDRAAVSIQIACCCVLRAGSELDALLEPRKAVSEHSESHRVRLLHLVAMLWSDALAS